MAVLAGSCQLTQHVFIQVPLHIQIRYIVFVQIIQTGNNFLQHLGGGNQEHGISHIPGKCRVVLLIVSGPTGNFHQFSLFGKVRQAAMSHVFNGREYPLGNDIVNIAGIIVFEFAPAHRLSGSRLRKNFIHLFAGHVFKFFRFQFFFI